MSKKVTENTEEKQEKVLTKYDLKMQRKAEEKKKAERERIISSIILMVIAVAVLCLLVSFPVKTYISVNGTYIKVAGESVSKVEFDYYYNVVKNDYISQNGYYLSMLGVDINGDMSKQMYSNTLTWQDYFEQLAVQNITNNKALRDQAKAEGFTYDATQDYADYRASVKEAASKQNLSEKAYLQLYYGSYSTVSRLKDIVMEALETNAYYQKVSEEKTPSGEEIQAYYEENKDTYDSVDYRITTVNAELPTEPTDLADPVEETGDTESEAADTETAYEPSEAEIEFAMQEAYAEAEEALKNISSEGELRENALRANVATLLREWLFDAERKAGDTTIVENTSSHLYYVVEFENRYRDETPSTDARIIIVSDEDGVSADAILEEWKSGAATEESFAELADKYDAATEGGLYEALIASGLPDVLEAWLYDGERTSGDAAAIAGGEGESSYVVYYLGTNDPRWSLNIESTLLQEAMSEYMDVITTGYDVEDSEGNLRYLKVQAAEAAAAESAAAESSEESSESTAE